MNVLGVRDQPESANNKLERCKEFAYMPGDNILKTMQYVFNAARGERILNKDEARLHLQRIYKTLYQPAGRNVLSYQKVFGSLR